MFARGLQWDDSAVKQDLSHMAMAPHTFGSTEQKQMGQWLKSRGEAMGLNVVESPFTVEVPNPALMDNPNLPAPTTLTREGTNLFAFAPESQNTPCTVILASHYDTKGISGVSYLGANDSASSSIALLHILNYLKQLPTDKRPRCQVLGVWFDGEEAVLPGWEDGEQRHPAKIQDNTYGSRYEATRFTTCGTDGNKLCLPETLGGRPIVAVILMDMIGSPAVRLTRESRGDSNLAATAMALDQALNEGTLLFHQDTPTPVSDDHIPFVQRGIPAIDLIDFHHLDVWHQNGDDVEHLSIESMMKVSRLALGLAHGISLNQ